MINNSDLKRGIGVEIEGQIFQVLHWQHIKMGRGGAVVRMKLRNLRTGAIMEQSFDSSFRFPRVDLDRHKVQYQYNDGDNYYFMDTVSFEQIALSSEKLGDAKLYLLDDMEMDIITYGEEPLSVELPDTVVLKVTYTEPGIKGDTTSGSTKPATLETGLVVQVPLFVTMDDSVRVKTETGTYLERA